MRWWWGSGNLVVRWWLGGGVVVVRWWCKDGEDVVKRRLLGAYKEVVKKRG